MKKNNMDYKYKTFKKWLYEIWPEQRDCLIISKRDEKMMRDAFNAARREIKMKPSAISTKNNW